MLAVIIRKKTRGNGNCFSRIRACQLGGLFCVCVAVLCVFLVGCSVPSASGRADTFGIDFSLPVGSKVCGAVVFVIDGVRADTFEEMLDAGELPAMKKYFVDRGIYVTRAVASTPSVTLANETSLITGMFPGHHGIVGINWFDRTKLIWRNYNTIAQKNMLDSDHTTPTIFERLPNQTTVSIFHQAHRGATKFVENYLSAGPMFALGLYEAVDRLTLYRMNIVADIARERKSWPAITYVYLLSPDFRGYASGVKSADYRQAIKHTDVQIGRVLGDLESAGILDKITIALVSDHGLDEVTKHFQVDEYLKTNASLNVAKARLFENTSFEKRLDYYRKHKAVLYGSGDKYWAICLRKPIRIGGKVDFASWTTRPAYDDLRNYPADGDKCVDLVAIMTDAQAVDVVACAAGLNRVRVCTKNGEVEFHQPSGRTTDITCKIISGKDPLRWASKIDDDILNGKQSLSPDQWLAITAETDYPDLPGQIISYFRSKLAGDIILFANPGWDFGKVNRAGHGGLRPSDMHIPLLIAGPGVPNGKRIKTARTIDLVPTILKLINANVPANLDGKNILAPVK